MLCSHNKSRYNWRSKITKVDNKTNRVSASVKALTEDPYDNIEAKYKVGEIYEGVVTKIMDYGCFVKIEDGVEGLIHNSELDWTNRNISPSKILSVSQKIKFDTKSFSDIKMIYLIMPSEQICLYVFTTSCKYTIIKKEKKYTK